MPTITLRPLVIIEEERGDVALDRHVWSGESKYGDPPGTPNTNRFGKRSHSTCPGFASMGDRAGYINSGTRQSQTLREEVDAGKIGFVITRNASEGAHERNAWPVFQVPISRVEATTITDARIVGTGGMISAVVYGGDANTPITKDGQSKWALKVWGVAEDNVTMGRITQIDAYDWTYMQEYYWSIPYKTFATYPGARRGGINGRRYMADSFLCMREHTNAVVKWEWPYNLGTKTTSQGSAPIPPPQAGVAWQSPNLVDIIKEITTRPGWKPGNRLALAWGPDGIWNDWPPPTFNHEFFANDSNNQAGGGIDNARLQITYTAG